MAETANVFLDAALYYAGMGIAVFPCEPGRKTPACANGFHDATTDEATIRAWWAKNPRANVAMATGKASGMFVVDIDPRHGGDESLTDLTAEHGPLPDTAEALTGGGGRHIFLAHPGGCVPCSQSEIAPGIDIKGDGGYVVMPPSIHPGGEAYAWEISSDIADVRPAACPDWLAALIRAGGAQTPQGRTSRPTDANVIPSGQRNNALASLAGGMRRMGMSQDEILAALQAANEARCNPPLPDREVEAIAASVARYEPDSVSVAMVENHYEQMFGPDEPEEPEECDKGQTAADPGPIPEDLFHVPGFVAEVMDFTLANAPYPNVGLAFCGAMALQSYLCGRKVQTTDDLRPNIYLLALASSGTGKDFPRKVNSRVLFEIGHISALGDKFASGQGIQDALLRSPAMLFQNDEMDGVLRQINFDRDNKLESIPNILLTLYTSADAVYPIRVKAGQKEASSIDQPYLTLFGTATPQYFYESLSQRMLTNGLFARMMIIDIGKRGRGQKPGSARHLPEAILQVARWWVEYQPGKRAGGNLYQIHPDPSIAPYTPEADQAIADLQRMGEDEYDKAHDAGDETNQTAWSRTCENAKKLALIYACSENHENPVITLPAVQWATDFAMHQTRRQLHLAATYVASSEFDATCKKALRFLKRCRDDGKSSDYPTPDWRLRRHLALSPHIYDSVTQALDKQERIGFRTIPVKTKPRSGWMLL